MENTLEHILKEDIMDKLDGLNAEKQKTLLINPNDYGKIIQDMVKVAKASDNHTWFLEPEEFLDKTYAQEDLDELSRDLQSIKEAGVHDMYSIVEMWDDLERGQMSMANQLPLFMEHFLIYLQKRNLKA